MFNNGEDNFNSKDLLQKGLGHLKTQKLGRADTHNNSIEKL